MKIVEGVSHLDHGLTPAQIEHIRTLFADRDAFFLETVELPTELGTIPCQLVGPATGAPKVAEENVSYAIRGTRKCASRILRDLELAAPTLVRTITIIAGPAGLEDGLPAPLPCVLYTAYAGPGAPREPGDPAISSWVELEASRAFWAEHALVD